MLRFPRGQRATSNGSMQRDLDPAVYLLASRRNGTLYAGVTSDLILRIAQHREGTFGGFTREHGVKRLVWFEQHATMEHAILREKRLKKWNRAWKLRLIEEHNPPWRDLAEDFGFNPLPLRHSRVGGNPGATRHGSALGPRLLGDDEE